MGSIIVKKLNNILLGFLGRIVGLDLGNFTLTTGYHQIEIPINIENPESVWVKFKSTGYDGCGQAVINKLGYELTPQGILFEVDVKTETCLVEWFVVN